MMYIIPILILILVIYFIQTTPELPIYLKNLFENIIFRFVIIAYIIYQGNNNPPLAIIISIGFLFIMHYLNRMKVAKIISSN